MSGRRTYTKEELDHAKTTMLNRLGAAHFKRLSEAFLAQIQTKFL